MPTLAANLLSDARKDDSSELQDLSERELRTASGFRTKRKDKKKSITVGKGGPGSGPRPGGGGLTPEQNAAMHAGSIADHASGTAEAHGESTAGVHAHYAAAALHNTAGNMWQKAGTGGQANSHFSAASYHQKAALYGGDGRQVQQNSLVRSRV